MEKLWNIRMRASKKALSSQLSALKQKEIHISGAEGLYTISDIRQTLWRYTKRALLHEKGKPDQITLTVEEVKREPLLIATLPLLTAGSGSLYQGRQIAEKLLQLVGVSGKALHSAFSLLGKGTMRGAALISSKNGLRLEYDRERGVRVSRLGIDKQAMRTLSSRLSRRGINTDTVKEALILASKVATCRGVTAEICISDDPHYTTGYVASKQFGYVRIPHMKKDRADAGGRVFFIQEGIDIDRIIQYLERTPVLVTRIGPCNGVRPAKEFLDNPDL